MNITNKQRAYLSSLANPLDTILSIGKNSLTTEFISSVDEALDKRELVKIGVLKNCLDDPKAIAEVLSERTRSVCVRVIGRKIILYRPAKKPIIELPR